MVILLSSYKVSLVVVLQGEFYSLLTRLFCQISFNVSSVVSLFFLSELFFLL